MKTRLICMIVLALLSIPSGAQDWQRGSMGNVEYNCDAIMGIIDDVGITYYLILGTDDLTPGDGDAEHYILTDISVVTVAESLLVRASGCGKAMVVDDKVVDIYEPDKWKPNITREYFYQCDIVRRIVAGFGDLAFRRSGERQHTVISFYQEEVPECVPPFVVTKVHSDVYACADSDCEKIDRIMRWKAWPVVGWSEGWYELALEDKTGFVAEADVAPGLYGLMQVEQLHASRYHDCELYVDRLPEDYRYIATLKAGPAYREIELALYKPAVDTPVEIVEERPGAFNDSGDPYLLQIYSRSDHFPMGAYVIELTWNGRTFRYGLEVQDHALFLIHVNCNLPESE